MASVSILAEPANRTASIHGRNPASPRQRLWRVLRFAAGPLSLGELFDAAGIEPELFFSLIENWASRGHLLTLVNPMRFLMTDAARGRVNPPPAIPSKPKSSVPKYSGRQRLWAAMRVLKEFDMPTLCMAAEVGAKGAQEFLNGLGSLDYVKVVSNVPDRATRWKLIRNTGPKHPILRLRVNGLVSVYELDDRNNGETLRCERDLSPWRIARKSPPADGGVS